MARIKHVNRAGTRGVIRYSGSRPLVPPPLAAYSTGQDDSSRSTSIKVPRSIFAGAIAEPRTELEFVDINEFSAALNLRDIAEAKQLPLLPLPPSLPKFGMAAMDKTYLGRWALSNIVATAKKPNTDPAPLKIKRQVVDCLKALGQHARKNRLLFKNDDIYRQVVESIEFDLHLCEQGMQSTSDLLMMLKGNQWIMRKYIEIKKESSAKTEEEQEPEAIEKGQEIADKEIKSTGFPSQINDGEISKRIQEDEDAMDLD